jgi:tetratricopeptide (TPR) repeat protein
MKKVVLASFLACAAIAPSLTCAFAQDAAPAAQPAPAAGAAPACGAPDQMAAPEYAVYNNAQTQTTPQAKAAAFEQYLTQFPQSSVKQAVLETLMVLYYSFDQAKALDAADRLLQVDPTNLKALLVETALRNGQASSITDAAAKQTAMDTVASYAEKGLAAPKPKCMSDADFTALKNSAYPTFYSVIGYDDLLKKDSAGAIDNYKKELAMVPPDATKTPGSVLQDIFYLGEAYYQATPPDYLDCAFYTSRAVAYAPDQYKALFSPTAKYCYKKYHGGDDGYDAVMAAATANLNPPDGFSSTIKPAPTPADIVNQVIASTPDLSTLATGDKEFILQNGTPDQAAKVWDTIKGKSFQFPDVLVISSTPTQVMVAISDDAVQSKTADFTFNLTPPEDLPEHATPAQKAAYKKKQDAIAAAIAPGQKVTLSGTFDSYTPKPIMIIMSDGAVVLPKPAAKAPVHHTTHK